MLTLPKLQALTAAAKYCLDTYTETRATFDSQRFLASVRFATSNSERKNDAQFIVSLGTWLEGHKFELQQQLAHQDYVKETAPVIKQALTGAFLLELAAITSTYSDEGQVYERSALGKVIMDVYGIKKLSDVTPEDQMACLEALQKVLPLFNEQMHPGKTNEAMLSLVEARLAELAPAPAAVI